MFRRRCTRWAGQEKNARVRRRVCRRGELYQRAIYHCLRPRCSSETVHNGSTTSDFPNQPSLPSASRRPVHSPSAENRSQTLAIVFLRVTANRVQQYGKNARNARTLKLLSGCFNRTYTYDCCCRCKTICTRTSLNLWEKKRKFIKIPSNRYGRIAIANAYCLIGLERHEHFHCIFRCFLIYKILFSKKMSINYKYCYF